MIVAQIVRGVGLLARRRQAALERCSTRLQPCRWSRLLATLVLLFGFQGEQIIAQPLVIALLAVPILIQVYFNSGLAYLLNRMSGERHCVAGPSALIGASNFFELAVAAAISLFGFELGCRARHRRRRADRGAGHAVGRVDREPLEGLVRARRSPP